MKKAILIGLLIVSTAVAGYTFYESWRLQDPAYQRERLLESSGMLETPLEGRRLVDLDRFMAETQLKTPGTREIVNPAPIRFTAAIRQAPDRIEATYVYTALGVMKIDPMPAINHRMFVETASGAVIPVYVWDEAVAHMTETQGPVELMGFHIYTYAKGPAIVVDAVI